MLNRIPVALIVCTAVFGCSPKPEKITADTPATYEKGSFGYDLDFLKKYDDVVVLSNGDAHVIVSPLYQGKVFTSTANGENGKSFGWINYAAFDKPVDPHMNAYGGENRFWLGPEGNRFSLFFKPGAPMDFENWKTPAAIDTEPWKLTEKSATEVSMSHSTELVNYQGTVLKAGITRTIKILDNAAIASMLGVTLVPGDTVVAYTTINGLTNNGTAAWTKESGAPCIWILDMFTPAPETMIVIPVKNNDKGKVVTSDYFGEIPRERLKYDNNMIVFVADGRSRGKIGVSPARAKNIAGSLNRKDGTLTLVTFDVDSTATYLNQEWNTKSDPYLGDAVNAYNDGPLADGTQMGPFYELESVSPAAFLAPGGTLLHNHSVFHLTASEERLRELVMLLFGQELN